jgi:hypothetical protein
MAYRRIDDNDTIEIRRAQGGNKPETRTVAELNEYFSKEENTDIEQLQAQVGDYDPTSTGSTITADLVTLQGEVETTTTGLLDRATALEAIVQTAIEGAPVTPVAAKLVTGSGKNWEITWEAVTKGDAGNAISIEIVNGTGESSPITISTTGNAISIALATDALGAPDNAANTATAVLTELNADEAAGALVQGTLTGGGGVCATEVSSNLAGGVDGTPGAKGALRFGTTALYVSTDASTTAVSNWKAITFDAE